MYNSKYYTCEQIDQRLLQGYVDDYNAHNGTTLNKTEFLDLLSTHLKTGLTLLNIAQSLGNSESKIISQKAITDAIAAIEAGGVILAQELGTSTLIGISQKAITDAINNTNSNISEEIGNRITKYNELLEAISQESTSREDADTALESRVNERMDNNDLNLSNLISEEATNRQTADQELESRINSSFSGDISGERSRAEGVEAELRGLISGEVSNRQTADQELESSLKSLIDAEETRAKGVEQDLSNRIDEEIGNRTGGYNSLHSEIENINTNIDDEKLRAEGVEAELRELISQETNNRTEANSNLQNQINSIKEKTDTLNVVQVFGDSTTDVISQAAITREIQNIYAKLVEITGEQGHGMILTITPDYFWEDTANITINATVEASVFDSLLIYANGELIAQTTNTNNFTFQYEINEDTVIKAVGTVLGITYTREHTITKVAGNMVVGAGETYEQVLNSGITIPYTNCGDHNVQVNVANDGDYIFVMLAATSTSPIHHILMSSLLVPTEVINTEQWIIYKSLNQYKANNYLICIN